MIGRVSNRWKAFALLFPIVGMAAATALAQGPGSQRAFFQAVWGVYSNFRSSYLTEDLAQGNDLTIANNVYTNTSEFPSFASSSAEFDAGASVPSMAANGIVRNILNTNFVFTIEAWVSFKDHLGVGTGGRDILFALDGGGTDYYYLGYRNSQINIVLRESSPSQLLILYTGISFPDDEWHHLAWVETHTNRVVYHNGAPVYTNTSAFSPLSPFPDNFVLGDISSVDYALNGYLSEIRIWNQERSSQQILDNYNGRMRGDEPGLVGYWPLNEGKL